MHPANLLSMLRQGGCRLISDGQTLRVHDPQRTLTDELRQAIREFKSELLTLLTEAKTPVPAAGYSYCPASSVSNSDLNSRIACP